MPSVKVNELPIEGSEPLPIEIEYILQGPVDGPVVVLIMGLNGQSLSCPYNTIVRPLMKAGYRVLRFDNRDAGLSTNFSGIIPAPNPVSRRAIDITNSMLTFTLSGFGLFSSSLWKEMKQDPPPYSLDDMAVDVHGLLDQLKIERAHIMGVSMGGMIAQCFASKYSEKVLSITSVMSTTHNRASYLQPSLTFLLKMFVGRRPPHPISHTEAIPRERSIHEWATFIVGGNKIIGSGPLNTFNGGYSLYELARLLVKRTINIERPNTNGSIRQIVAIDTAPCRDDNMALVAPKIPTLIAHGTHDRLVPTSNAPHLFTVMANAIIQAENEKNIANGIDEPPRPSFSVKDIQYLRSHDGKTRYADVEDPTGSYVRLLLIEDTAHDLCDRFALGFLPAFMKHLADANSKSGIVMKHSFLENPWPIPPEQDLSDPHSKIPGVGSCFYPEKTQQTDELITKILKDGGYYKPHYFSPIFLNKEDIPYDYVRAPALSAEEDSLDYVPPAQRNSNSGSFSQVSVNIAASIETPSTVQSVASTSVTTLQNPQNQPQESQQTSEVEAKIALEEEEVFGNGALINFPSTSETVSGEAQEQAQPSPVDDSFDMLSEAI